METYILPIVLISYTLGIILYTNYKYKQTEIKSQ